MSDITNTCPIKITLCECLGEPRRVYAVLRNEKLLRKAVYATLQHGAKYRKPTIIHKGGKP